MLSCHVFHFLFHMNLEMKGRLIDRLIMSNTESKFSVRISEHVVKTIGSWYSVILHVIARYCPI